MNHRSATGPSEAASFAELARRYCDLIDSAEAVGAETLLRRLQVLLPQVYAAGAALPRFESLSARGDDPVERSAQRAQYDRLERVLGARARYWEVYDPGRLAPDDPVAGNLADDLADIYHDLTRGLAQAPAETDGGAWTDAVWEWRFSWEIHWGAHAADAIRAIHWQLDTMHREDASDE